MRFTRRSPSSAPAGPGPAAPNSFVGSVVDRIPPQYRWPVLVLACLAMLFAFTSLRERRRSVRVERAALVDSLTGLPNRPAFERRLAKEWRRSERYDRPLGMLLIDLDDFKQVNDTQGHAAGDAVLREVAAAISGRIRVSDMAARLGRRRVRRDLPGDSARRPEDPRSLARGASRRRRRSRSASASPSASRRTRTPSTSSSGRTPRCTGASSARASTRSAVLAGSRASASPGCSRRTSLAARLNCRFRKC